MKEELDYVKDYMFIQKTRFPQKFETNIEVDQQVSHIKIPFMTLMVLVENLIFHGFSNIRQSGNLHLKGYKEEETAVFVVEDNGGGIPQEIIKQVENLNHAGFNSSTVKNIGFKNIYMRLSHFYGEQF